MVAMTTAAFAGSPKNETKEANATEAKTSSKANLVWYPVTYDGAHMSGYIPAGTASVTTGDKSQAEDLGICPDGTNFDCLRGFDSAPLLPTSNAGTEQVKTDDKP